MTSVINEPHGQESKSTHISWNSGRAKQAGVLVHVERCAPDGIGFEDTTAKVMNKTKRRDDKRCRARKLSTAIWCWIIPA